MIKSEDDRLRLGYRDNKWGIQWRLRGIRLKWKECESIEDIKGSEWDRKWYKGQCKSYGDIVAVWDSYGVISAAALGVTGAVES